MEDFYLGSLFESLSQQNHRFKLFPYFTNSFGVLPSAVKIILPMEGKKDVIDSILKDLNLEKVSRLRSFVIDSILKDLNLETFSFQPIFKNWITDDSKDAKT